MQEKPVITVKETDKQGNVVERTYVICEVCGHANDATKAQCEMCSNYLYQERTYVRK